MTNRKHLRAGNSKTSVWKKTPTPCLIRYKSGSYYMRARIGGKIFRQSLKTQKYSVARYRVGERLRELRNLNGSRGAAIETLADALKLVRAQVANDPSLKSATRASYLEELDCLRLGKPAAAPATPIGSLSAPDLSEWWATTARHYAPQRANHLLRFVKRALELARKSGALFHDPSVELKPVAIPRTRLDLPTPEQLRRIIESIRAQGKAHSEEAANWVEFMALSGMRPAEIAALRWEHVSLTAICVYGGVEETKNRQFRLVPISPPLSALLLRIRGELPRAGRVFHMETKPRNALQNACKRLGLKRQRVYSLRHFFATWCANSGVNVSTFSAWMGHQDGGTLALKTYVQSVDEHHQLMAKRLSFA